MERSASRSRRVNELNEILAIIRPGKDRQTKAALARIGCPAVTSFRAQGRGRQRGLRSPIVEGSAVPGVLMRYLPKKMLLLIVPEKKTKSVIQTILSVNQTGQYGDGKIFVLPMEESRRIRTGESGETALK